MVMKIKTDRQCHTRLELRRDEMVHRAVCPARLGTWFSLLLLCSLGVSSLAIAAPVEPAKVFVQSLGNEVVEILQNTALDRQQRKAALHTVFLRAFDAEATGRFVLGRYWRTATDAQKTEYRRLFPEYVADIYAGQFATYDGETFSTHLERRIDGRRFLVNAEIRRPGRTSLNVDFKVRRDDGVFRIVDVMVERVSLVITKRDEFGSVIRREGMDALLRRMRRQVESRPSASRSSMATRNVSFHICPKSWSRWVVT